MSGLCLQEIDLFRWVRQVSQSESVRWISQVSQAGQVGWPCIQVTSELVTPSSHISQLELAMSAGWNQSHQPNRVESTYGKVAITHLNFSQDQQGCLPVPASGMDLGALCLAAVLPAGLVAWVPGGPAKNSTALPAHHNGRPVEAAVKQLKKQCECMQVIDPLKGRQTAVTARAAAQQPAAVT